MLLRMCRVVQPMLHCWCPSLLGCLSRMAGHSLQSTLCGTKSICLCVKTKGERHLRLPKKLWRLAGRSRRCADLSRWKHAGQRSAQLLDITFYMSRLHLNSLSLFVIRSNSHQSHFRYECTWRWSFYLQYLGWHQHHISCSYHCIIPVKTASTWGWRVSELVP